MDPQLLNTLVQGGSFAVLVTIIVYVGRVLIPKAFAALEAIVARFDAALERRDAAVEKLGEKVDGLRAGLDSCPHRHALPVLDREAGGP